MKFLIPKPQEPIFLLLISFILIASSCHKKPEPFTPTLPPITTTGENTFGCYINGQLLTPRDKIDWENSLKGIRFTDITCSGRRFAEIVIIDDKSDKQGSIGLHLENFFELNTGNYPIMLSNCQDRCDANQTINVRCSLSQKNISGYKLYCSIENIGTLTLLRIDYGNKIVSGTFNFSAVNRDDATDIIEITDGRFDINWGTVHETDFP